MFKCPYPSCDHVFPDVLTKHHCEMTHGMTIKAVTKLYGDPEFLRVDYRTLKKNVAMQRVLTKSDFQM